MMMNGARMISVFSNVGAKRSIYTLLKMGNFSEANLASVIEWFHCHILCGVG